MNLRIKFNIVIIIGCAISFSFIYFNVKEKITQNQNNEIENKAELILSISDILNESPLTSDNPILNTKEVLSELNSKDNRYTVVFSNPRNKNYQANIWQQEIIDIFNKSNNKSRYQGTKSDENGEFYFTSKAIIGEDNKANGAIIVAIYKYNYHEILREELLNLMTTLVILFIVLLIVINVLIHFLIVAPIKKIAMQANQISKGTASIEELKHKNNDEISELTNSFNRIIRSLKAAMKLLNN